MIANTVLSEGVTRTAKATLSKLDDAQAGIVLQDITNDTFEASNELREAKASGAARPTGRQSAMAIHLHEGFNHIRKGQFEEAIKHFQDRQKLKAMDVGAVWGRPAFASTTPKTAIEAKKLVMQAAKENMAYNKDGHLSIKFSNIAILDHNPDELFIPKNASEAAITKHLQHEQALMAAEENLHIYQNINNKNITYEAKPGHESSNDDEIDIATTFAKHNLPVTADFLNRYPERQTHAKFEKVWNLRTARNGEVSRVEIPKSQEPVRSSSLANLFNDPATGSSAKV